MGASDLFCATINRTEMGLISKGSFWVKCRPKGLPAWPRMEGLQEVEQGKVAGKSVLQVQA